MATNPAVLRHHLRIEIFGPIMVGPSSSHTAGALRCARVAATLIEGEVTRVTFTLWNSFAHTYRGHGTDRALVAGILGLDTDDERIRDAFALAGERGLTYEFKIAGDDPSIHPEHRGHPPGERGRGRGYVRGESLGGGKMRISAINGVQVEILRPLHHAVRRASRCTGRARVAHRSARESPDEHRLPAARTAPRPAVRHTRSSRPDGAPRREALPIVRSLDLVNYATFIELPGSVTALGPGVSVPDLFDDASQLLRACRERGLGIGGVMRLREERMIGPNRAQRNMRRVMEVMREETTQPLEAPKRSLGGFLNGEAQRVGLGGSAFASSLLGSTQTDAVARAMAVLERSATMGVIVAAPTAGSAGVVPGCVLAVVNLLASDADEVDAMVEDALYCAAGIGLILATSACVAGAEGGCQAEVGSAAAMAAAALVQMHGGTPEQALDAASITISQPPGTYATPWAGSSRSPPEPQRDRRRRRVHGCAARALRHQVAVRSTRWRPSCSAWGTPCPPPCARPQRAASPLRRAPRARAPAAACTWRDGRGRHLRGVSRARSRNRPR